MKTNPKKQGVALITVLCLTALGLTVATLMASMVYGASLRSRGALQNEQAFYVAEGAVELAVQNIATNDTVPTTLTGSLAAGTYVVSISNSTPVDGMTCYQLIARGTVGNQTRSVNVQGVRQQSWARFALWYDQESIDLWMVGGEKFMGPVHANTRFRFHSHNVATRGQTRFYDTVGSTASSYDRSDNAAQPIFDYGLTLNAQTQTTQSVSFDVLRTNADLVYTGYTTIQLNRTNMIVNNPRGKIKNKSVPLMSNGSIFVRTSGTNFGTVQISGTNNGRLTLIAERDIQITNHLRYASNPVTNPLSEDVLGLVAQRHVTVETNAPRNLDVYAHVIAATGGFGVVQYDSTKLGDRGVLTVYGGVVNLSRQPVGTTGGTGYNKNYIYDPRFRNRAPPGYPVLPFRYQWSNWNDKVTS